MPNWVSHFGQDRGLCSIKNQSRVSLILSNYLHLKHQMTYQVNMSDTQVLVSGITSR